MIGQTSSHHKILGKLGHVRVNVARKAETACVHELARLPSVLKEEVP